MAAQLSAGAIDRADSHPQAGIRGQLTFLSGKLRFDASRGRGLSSAAWADAPDQPIKPRIVPPDPSSQSVFVGVDLVRANLLIRACLDWLPLAYESLDVTMFFHLGGVRNSH